MARQGNWPFRASRHPLVATAFVAVLGTCGVALFVPGGRAASLCPDTYTHYCFNGQGNFYVHDVGFSTTGPPCSHGGSGYGDVYLSSSDTDPHVNQGPIYHDSLFFWASSAGPGYGFEMSLTSIGGDIEITGFEFAPGTNGKFIPPGTLWWGNCADGQVLVGRLIVEQPIAVEPETWGRMKALYRWGDENMSRDFSRLRGAPGESAVAIVTCLSAVALSLWVPSARAAQLCQHTLGHDCTTRVPIWAPHEVGFSTDGSPCETGSDRENAIFISSSPTDPHVNQGPILDDSLYLWSWSTVNAGYGFGFATTGFSGDVRAIGFEPYNAWVLSFAWPSMYWYGCFHGYTLLGRLVLEPPMVAVEQPTWGRMKALYR